MQKVEKIGKIIYGTTLNVNKFVRVYPRFFPGYLQKIEICKIDLIILYFDNKENAKHQ